MRRSLVIIVPVVFILMIAFTLIRNKQGIEKAKSASAFSSGKIPVEIFRTTTLPVKSSLQKTGNLFPFQEVDVMALGSGMVTSLQVELGTHVTKGSTLGQIDNKIKQLALEQAKQLVSKLAVDKQRYSALLLGKATTSENVQTITYNYNEAVNQVAQLQKQLMDMKISSPINGQVVTKSIEPGEFVNAGTPVVKIVDLSRLKVQAMLEQSDAYQVSNGQQVSIIADVYPDHEFIGKVTYLAPQGDDLHNYMAEITLQNSPDHPLKAGTFVYLDFRQTHSLMVMQIPRDAVVESVRNPYVYIVVNGRATIRKLTLGRVMGNMLEVIKGLQNGEQVITKGQINLKEGTPVQVINVKQSSPIPTR